jgi:hypothetical protein
MTYSPYAFAVIVCGFGLYLGVFQGDAPFSMTVVPAVAALIMVGLTLSIVLVPPDLQRRIARRGKSRLAQKLAHVPASSSAGVRDAIRPLRSRDPALLGAILFWACQIAVVWAAFRAFTFWLPLIPGVIAFFRLRGTVDQWRRERGATIQSKA